MTHMNAGAPDKSNDGWTPGGGDESDRLGPGHLEDRCGRRGRPPSCHC